MRDVPAQVERHEEETRDSILSNRVRRDASIVIGAQAAVFGDRTQSVHHAPHGEVWNQPIDEVCPRRHGPGKKREQRDLHEEDLGVGVAREGNAAKQPDDLSAQHFAAGHEQCVSAHLAPEARARDRIVGIQRNVGFVRSELLAVVRHVHDAVAVGVGERRIAEQPATDKVVDGLVAHEQPMHGLVHQPEALGMRATHEQDRDRGDEEVVEAHRD